MGCARAVMGVLCLSSGFRVRVGGRLRVNAYIYPGGEMGKRSGAGSGDGEGGEDIRVCAYRL